MNTEDTPISVAITMAGSQQKLAALVGVHQTAISHFFLGRKRPRPEVAKRLQKVVKNQFQWYEFIEQGDSKDKESDDGGAGCVGRSHEVTPADGGGRSIPAEGEGRAHEHGAYP